MSRFAAAVSRHADPRVAVGEAAGELLERLGATPSLLTVFFTGAHLRAAGQIAAALEVLIRPQTMIGASASAVLGNGEGIEGGPGLALWAAELDGEVRPFHLEVEPVGDAYRISGLRAEDLAVQRTMLLLADPFSFPASELIAGLADDHPRLGVIGGLASAAGSPGANRLLNGTEVVASGAVGVLLDEASSPTTVVSQGCRPIGRPYTVTASEGNLIGQLGGRPALDRLLAIIDGLDPVDRALAAEGLHCGIVVDEHHLEFERGDFLIRGVLGADRSTGAIAVGEIVPVGATVQFQVRDAATAGDDLHALLGDRDGRGALVFTCTGRGSAMFGRADHDADAIVRTPSRRPGRRNVLRR